MRPVGLRLQAPRANPHSASALPLDRVLKSLLSDRLVRQRCEARQGRSLLRDDDQRAFDALQHSRDCRVSVPDRVARVREVFLRRKKAKTSVSRCSEGLRLHLFASLELIGGTGRGLFKGHWHVPLLVLWNRAWTDEYTCELGARQVTLENRDEQPEGEPDEEHGAHDAFDELGVLGLGVARDRDSYVERKLAADHWNEVELSQ